MRNILAIIAGLAAGSALNMALVALGPIAIPPPPGVDVTDPASLSTAIHLFEARHFVFPFLGHALGTLVGALIVFLIAASRRTAIALRRRHRLSGRRHCRRVHVPAPLCFEILDLVAAYIPMTWIGVRLARRFTDAG